MFRLKTFVDNIRPVAVATYRTLTREGCERASKQSLLVNNKSQLQGHFVRYYAASGAAEPFLNGSSSSYVEEMYEAWQQNPASVHKVGNFPVVQFVLIVKWLSCAAVGVYAFPDSDWLIHKVTL